jgi:hypothetical protein
MEQIKYVALGDNFLVDKAKKTNETLEKINAPYYQVCKKLRGKANKDAYAISWRKKNMSCDSEYPNVTATSEKVVDRYLQKIYNVSLNSLIKTPIASIKKANDYVLKINAEKEKKEQLKRKKIEEREAKRLAISTKKGKKENKTIKKETEKELFIKPTITDKYVKVDKDGNIVFFSTINIRNIEKRHAKLNLANNRVTYLNSNTPQYVKDFIKQYKLNPNNSEYKGKPIEKPSPAKEERAKSIKSNKKDYLNYKEWRKEEREKYKDAIENMYLSIKNDLPKEIQNVIELLPVKNGYKIEFNTNDSEIIRINIEIDRSVKSGKNKDVIIKFDYDTQKKYIETDSIDGVDLFEKSKMYKEVIKDIVFNIKEFSKIPPAKEESNNKIKIEEVIKYIVRKADKENIKITPLKMEKNYIPLKVYGIGKLGNYLGEIRLSQDVNNQRGFILRAWINGDDVPMATIEDNYNVFKSNIHFLNKVDNIFKWYKIEDQKQYQISMENKREQNEMKTKEEKPKEEIKMIEEEQVLIPKEPEIKIDDAEAEKFDKGLDELTKLLQQAMQ